MSQGYGRGYYGPNQLAPRPRRGGGWLGKVAIVAGVGAVVWLVWPRRRADLPSLQDPQPPAPPQPIPVHVALEAPPQHAQLQQLAQSRGYPSAQAYEDAVVDMVKQLQHAGAKVVLEPHLSHLAPRLAAPAPTATPTQLPATAAVPALPSAT